MEPDKTEPPLAPEFHDRRTRKGIDPVSIVAWVLSLAWLAGVAALWLFSAPAPDAHAPRPIGLLADVLSILLPLVLIWLAAVGLRTTRALRAQTRRLQESIDAMRHAHVMQQQTMPMRTDARPDRAATGQPDPADGSAAPAPDTPAQADTQTPSAQDEMPAPADDDADDPATRPALVPAPGTADDAQAVLALDEPTDTHAPDADSGDDAPITIAEFIRAMNFPENEDDAEGFRTLRRALDDRRIARMIRASQDVLTLLSQDGIYMDELRPDKPRAETWRRFARGERGPAVAGLGGIHDRACLSRVGARMKSDPVFRDAVLHFMRQFDKVLTEFEENATDRELIEMGETRTARAFMLLGRVAGAFD